MQCCSESKLEVIAVNEIIVSSLYHCEMESCVEVNFNEFIVTSLELIFRFCQFWKIKFCLNKIAFNSLCNHDNHLALLVPTQHNFHSI